MPGSPQERLLDDLVKKAESAPRSVRRQGRVGVPRLARNADPSADSLTPMKSRNERFAARTAQVPSGNMDNNSIGSH